MKNVLMALACAVCVAWPPAAAGQESTPVTDEGRDDVRRLVAALEKGERAVMKFEHPLTGEPLERTVLGKGHYVEEVPGGFLMEVKFTGERLALLMAYLRSLATAKEVKAGVKLRLDSSGESSTAYELHDGKQVFNPLNDASARETGEVVLTQKQ